MSERIQQAVSNYRQLPSLLSEHFRSCGHYWGLAVTSATVLIIGARFLSPPKIGSRQVGLTKNTSTKKERHYTKEDTTSDVFVLPDGRDLSFAQYGDLPQQFESDERRAKRKTIFYCHGLPGSRIEIASFDPIASRLGLRIIAVERPGYGWSTPHPSRTLLDHAKDTECLAEHFELQEYGVLGISGGGPYALACAAVLPPSKLKAISIVCGVGPPDLGTRGMNIWHRLGFSFGWPYFPNLVAYYLQREPVAQLHLSDAERYALVVHQFKNAKHAHPKDVETFTDLGFLDVYLRSGREVYAQGWAGIGLDGQLIATDWRFKLEDIRDRNPNLQVRLWYGEHDNFVPARHGEGIAKKLGNLAHLRVEDETHASLFKNCKQAFIEDMARCMQ